MKAIDCATKISKTTAQALKKAGIEAIGRYLGPKASWKAVSRNEVNAANAAGLRLFSIWETAPTRAAYFTEKQAISDAAAAENYAAAIGQPAGTAIFFTVDYQARTVDFPVIVRYFAVIRRSLRRYALGVYGSYTVVEWLAGSCDYFYQTYAWSGGRQSRHAHIYQYANNRLPAGIRVDYDRISNCSVTWTVNKAVKTASAAIVPYPGKPLKRGSRGREVVRVQNAVKVTADGQFGPITERAVTAYQKRHGLVPDGIVGPITWNVMF
ncbi:MAG: DUF1906 domain-containing protein [Sporolactobacillus sp.]|jgi:hypothetical protein|nr:DUF1906 domain-containing protein [Sporolactobacillus sp.]